MSFVDDKSQPSSRELQRMASGSRSKIIIRQKCCLSLTPLAHVRSSRVLLYPPEGA